MQRLFENLMAYTYEQNDAISRQEDALLWKR